MAGMLADLEEFMQQYFGSGGGVLLRRELSRIGVSDVEKSDFQERRRLMNSLTDDLLEPVMSKGRVSLARSRLMGILKIRPMLLGLPSKEAMTPRVVEYFKNIKEFMVKEELRNYGAGNARDVGVDVRVRILEGIMEKHLGGFSRILLEEKMRELHIGDLNRTRDYVRIMLMESIITSLINVCVAPVTARMIRSEISSILDLDVYVLQCMEKDFEGPAQALKKELDGDMPPQVRLSPERRRDFEDLALLVVKEEMGRAGVHNAVNAAADVKSTVLLNITGRIFGGVSAHIVNSMSPKSPEARIAFAWELMKTYLADAMGEQDAVESLEKITRPLVLA